MDSGTGRTQVWEFFCEEDKHPMRGSRSVFLAVLLGPAGTGFSAFGQSELTFERFLRDSAVPKDVIDRFLRGPAWARFDPELGYVPGNYLPADGMDNSSTISTVQSNGARTQFLYAGRPCRINTYGNSFTHGDQVNDGETWQEYLAGHLGEPIRNFGVGGYGVYQAYRRMIREERKDHGAGNLILYIWGTIIFAASCAAATRLFTSAGATAAARCFTRISGLISRWTSTPASLSRRKIP